MHSLPEHQKNILEFLLDKSDGATIDEICRHLGVTKTAAMEQLRKVERLGYIIYRDARGSIGRPKRSYLLSAEGQEAFPKQYSWLSNVLLELLAENLGAEAVGRIMKDLARKVAGPMEERFKNKSQLEMLRELTKVMNELGYRAYLKQSDLRKGAVLEANNCVYHSVAKEHPELCQFDVQFLKEVSGLSVKLESCIARGGASCRFCLRN